jgi:hypothetical protein
MVAVLNPGDRRLAYIDAERELGSRDSLNGAPCSDRIVGASL